MKYIVKKLNFKFGKKIEPKITLNPFITILYMM